MRLQKARMILKVINRNLRLKVTLSIALPLSIILGAIIVGEYSRQKENTLADLSLLATYSGQILEFNLQNAMIETEFDEVRSLLNLISESQEFENVFIVSADGEVVFAPDGMATNRRLDTGLPGCQPYHRLEPDERPQSVVVDDHEGQAVFRSMRPIRNQPVCAECHDPDQPILGGLVTDISMTPLQSTLTDSLKEDLLWGVNTVLVTVIVVNLILSRVILNRLERVATAIAGLGEGYLPPPFPTGQPDEIGQLTTAFNLMVQQIEERNSENRQLSEDLRRQSAQRGELLKRIITTQEDERKRVAREIHDELGQSLTGLALRAEALERLVQTEPERAQQQLMQIQGLITETTDRMYDLILDLRPSVLDDLGLVAALKTCAERGLADKSITFEIAADEMTGRLPPEIETALYRIFQEAINNVIRHANASRIYIELARHDDAFVGKIMDNGDGFAPESVHVYRQAPRGFGLMGIQERVAQVGGQLEITSQPGKGTQLRIHVPLSGDSV